MAERTDQQPRNLSRHRCSRGESPLRMIPPTQQVKGVKTSDKPGVYILSTGPRGWARIEILGRETLCSASFTEPVTRRSLSPGFPHL